MSLREIEKWEIDANMEKDRDLFYWRKDFSHLIESHKFIIRGARGLGKSAIMNNLLLGENTALVRLQDTISEGSHARLRKHWQLFIEREISEQLRMKVQSLV
jgi:putative ribosome biogenesis GTPase RsgA